MNSSTSPAYEVWDLDTGCLVDGYADERSALALVREAIAQYGEIHGRSVWQIDRSDHAELLLGGAALVEEALRRLSA